MRAFYRIIDHTADVGIEAVAPDLESLFDRCAAGMFSLLHEGATAQPLVAVSLTLAAHDLPELLVAWLRELLWLHGNQDWLYAACHFERLTDGKLAATARGQPVDPERQRIVREIKAVTYHDLVVEPQGDGWLARVILDV